MFFFTGIILLLLEQTDIITSTWSALKMNLLHSLT
jgi:hypothetical protein